MKRLFLCVIVLTAMPMLSGTEVSLMLSGAATGLSGSCSPCCCLKVLCGGVASLLAGGMLEKRYCSTRVEGAKKFDVTSPDVSSMSRDNDLE